MTDPSRCVEVEVEREEDADVEIDSPSGRSTITVDREEKGLSFPPGAPKPSPNRPFFGTDFTPPTKAPIKPPHVFVHFPPSAPVRRLPSAALNRGFDPPSESESKEGREDSTGGGKAWKRVGVGAGGSSFREWATRRESSRALER